MRRLHTILAGIGALTIASLLVGFYGPTWLSQIIPSLPGGTTNLSGQVIIEDAAGSPPTCATSTAAGELCVEGDIETNGNIDNAGTLTQTGAATFSTTITLQNSETIINSTDDIVCIGGGGGTSDENLCFDVDGTNTVGLSSTTGALEVDMQSLNLALNDDADIVLGTGNDVIITFDATAAAPDSLIIGVGQESRQIQIMEAADIATDLTIAQQTNPTLLIHSADATTATDYVAIAHDQTDGTIVTGGGNLVITPAGGTTSIVGTLSHTTRVETAFNAVTGADALVAGDCGRVTTVSAGIDTNSLTLPATILGCQYTIVYIGASAGALVDISPNASDGIYGSCNSDADNVDFSGTDDADIGLTKASSIKGNYIQLMGDGADGWFVTGCSGIWANN